MSETWKTVSATGHREVPADAEPWVRAELVHCARWLHEHGTRYAISGMARGVDLWWADAAVTAGLHLCAAIPFEEQPAHWPRAQQAEWRRLRRLAVRERVIGVLPADTAPRQRSATVNRLLHARNDFMLDRAAGVVAVWERGRFDGGTHGALVKAARRHLPGIWLDPAARSVAFTLPGLPELTKHVLYHDVCGCVAATGTHADMSILRTTFQAAGLPQWRIRVARPREAAGDGCPTCTAPSPEELIAS